MAVQVNKQCPSSDTIKRMKLKLYLYGGFALILAGVGLLILYLLQPVRLIVNGSPMQVSSLALTVRGITAKAGYPIRSGDFTSPTASALLLDGRTIHLRHAIPVILWLDGERLQLESTARYPVDLLNQYGIPVFPGDLLWTDGMQTAPSQPFSSTSIHTIQLLREARGSSILLPEDTLGLGLARRGEPLFGLDRVSVAEDSPSGTQPFTIERVQQVLDITLTSLPYQQKRQLDPERELNTETIIQSGMQGLAVDLKRTRLVNGVEVSSDSRKSLQLAAPVDEIIRIGTQAVVKTTTVEGTTFNYWYSVPMYATTYAPTEGGGGTTYSGKPVTQGVAAVIRAWYPAMSGQPIYVTGYGYATIEDIGGGIPGKPWIDLAYDDATYQAWSGWVTVYFLPPVAPAIIEILN